MSYNRYDTTTYGDDVRLFKRKYCFIYCSVESLNYTDLVKINYLTMAKLNMNVTFCFVISSMKLLDLLEALQV